MRRGRRRRGRVGGVEEGVEGAGISVGEGIRRCLSSFFLI